MSTTIPVNDISTGQLSKSELAAWNTLQKVSFRFAFSFVLLLAIPLDWHYYQKVFSIDWGNLYYGDIFTLARYFPGFLTGTESFADLFFVAGIAGIATLVWSALDKDRLDYRTLYYWLRVSARYRLAAGVIAYAWLKIFLLQSPAPVLSELNTQYGEFTHWKLFSLSLGAAPVYEQFLGWVELTAGILLLHRKTAIIGAAILFAFLGNIFLSNLAYEGGEYVYSSYLIIFVLIILFYDAGRIISLLSLEKPTVPNLFHPVFSPVVAKLRWVLKGAFVLVFVVLYGFKVSAGAKENPHNIPVAKGLPGISGVYDVRDFVLNGDTIPYDPLHPVRWQQVVFEEWATVSIRSNREVVLFEQKTEIVNGADRKKLYDVSGVIRRHFYWYDWDQGSNVLKLANKNPNHSEDVFELIYTRPDDHTILVEGRISGNQQIKARLERIDKKYLFKEGRRTPQTL